MHNKAKNPILEVVLIKVDIYFYEIIFFTSRNFLISLFSYYYAEPIKKYI